MTALNIAIIGAGVTGVQLAHTLAQEGHHVQVFEQRQTVAEEASFAGGPLLSAGWPSPLAAPGMAWDLLYPGSSPTAIRLASKARPSDWAWLVRWWQHTGKAAHEQQRAAALALTQLSLRELHRTRAELDLEFDFQRGVTVLLRSSHDTERFEPYLKWLGASGVAHQVGDAVLAQSIEPGLNPQTPVHTTLHLPTDAVGNCRQYTSALKTEAQNRGVVFAFSHQLLQVAPQNKGVRLTLKSAQQAHSHEVSVDAVVMCTGAHTPALLTPLGVKLPWQTLRSHSLSANLRDPADAPLSAVVDALHNVSISRLGQRIRISGGQELGWGKPTHNETVLKQLYKVLFDWFPGAAQMGSIQTWAAHNLVLPDGLPVIGPSGVPGVWLNVGHGLRGWSMSGGSARWLADQLAGHRATDWPSNAFSAKRWSAHG